MRKRDRKRDGEQGKDREERERRQRKRELTAEITTTKRLV